MTTISTIAYLNGYLDKTASPVVNNQEESIFDTLLRYLAARGRNPKTLSEAEQASRATRMD